MSKRAVLYEARSESHWTVFLRYYVNRSLVLQYQIPYFVASNSSEVKTIDYEIYGVTQQCKYSSLTSKLEYRAV